MPQDTKNTPQRDHDYGTAGNASYEQMRTFALAQLKIVGKDSEKLGSVLLDQIEHPKFAQLITIPKSLLEWTKYDPSAAREGLDDAFVQSGLPAPSSQRTR